MELGDYSYVLGGKFRRRVFMELRRKRIPSDIASDIKASTTQVSRTLKQLERRGLVECLTPGSKKGKIYSLTEKGKELLAEIEKDSDS
jgi:DNA-binding MarR family transcriptional regulator